MKRSMVKLHRSARQRFPWSRRARRRYIDLHLRISDRHDTEHYWIAPDRFARLCRHMRRAFGPRRSWRQRFPGPGTTLAWTIRIATFGMISPCPGCNGRRRRLDQTDWRPFLRIARPRSAAP